MDQGSNTASFTGILLKRERSSERNLVQLLFREDDKNVLCVSTDPKDATWQVGQTYKVEGTLAEKLGRKFIENPHITLVKKHWPIIRRAGLGVAVLAILGGGGSVFALRTIDGGATVPAPAAPAVTYIAKPALPAAAPVAPAPAPALAPAPAATTAVKKTTPKVTTAKATVTAPVAAAPAPAVTQPVTPPAVPATNEDTTPPVDSIDSSTPPATTQDTPPANGTQPQS